VKRFPFRALLGLAVAACSAKSTSPDEPRTAQAAPATEVQAAATSAPAAGPPTPKDPREAALASTVLQLLEHEHLLHKTIDDNVSRQAFNQYLERLDAGKLFLLKSDRDGLARYADKIDDELRDGSLDLAHEGERVFEDRVGQVDKIVADILAKPMNHDDDETLELDPKKIEPPATEDELRDRWRKKLELEVLERVDTMQDRLDAEAKAKTDPKKKAEAKKADDRSLPIASIPKTFADQEAKARGDLAKSYASRFARLREPGKLDAASDLINAVTLTLDPHTDYLPPSDKANFDIEMSGSLEGIGAALREKDDYIEVSELVPGGAASRQGGLAPGDLILSVANEGQDPTDIVNMRLDDVVKMIRGKKGTVVTLRVRKADGHEESISITRDVVVIEEAYARAALLSRAGKSGSPKVGYIHLPSFYGTGKRTSAKDLDRLFGEMKAEKVAGVILDLRSNGGGLLQDAVDITGELIDNGPVVQVRDSRGKKEVLGDENKGETYDGPLLVLVDQFSASASEILAGALQDYHRAIIVGTASTHGKGTVQTLADLDRVSGSHNDLGVLKITIEQFFRVSGDSTQRQGVKPDILLPNPNGYIDSSESSLEHALPFSKIDPAPHDDWRMTANISQLAEKSAARVAKDPLLSKIAGAVAVLKARKDDTKVPLSTKAWEERRKQQKAELDAASPELAKAPPRLTVTTLAGSSGPGPGPAAKADDLLVKWQDSLARDPWVDESVSILGDMK
jgi:carboxyl-terminal processing protease